MASNRTSGSLNQGSPQSPSAALEGMASPMAMEHSGVAAASIKGKLQAMETLMRQITEEMNFYKRESLAIKSEKETLENVLASKIMDAEKGLGNELGRVEDEMKRHFSHQKAENSRLQQQLNQLKTDKEELRKAIEQLAERIDDLEIAVGEDEAL